VVGVYPYVPQPQDFQYAVAFTLRIGANPPEFLTSVTRRQTLLAVLCKALNRSPNCAGFTSAPKNETDEATTHGIVLSAASEADVAATNVNMTTILQEGGQTTGVLFQALQQNGFDSIAQLVKGTPAIINKGVFAASSPGISFVLTVTTEYNITKPDQAAIIAGVSRHLLAFTNRIEVIDVSPSSLYDSNAKDIGIYVQSGSTYLPPPTPDSHVTQMLSKIGQTSLLLQSIQMSGMPGWEALRIANTPVRSTTPGATTTQANISTVLTTVIGVSETYLVSTAAKTAFAGAFAKTTGINAACVYVKSVTPVDLGLLVAIVFTCDANQRPFKSAGAASNYADELSKEYLPSPGRSNNVIDTVRAAGLVNITLCDAPMVQPVKTDQTLYVGATVGMSLILTAGFVAMIIVGVSKNKPQIENVAANLAHNQMFFPVKPATKGGWRQRFARR
jgi:hypothetical protein